MKCKKCGTVCNDGNIFCENCGAELEVPVLPENVDEMGRVNGADKKSKRKEKSKQSGAEPKPKKQKTPKKEKTEEEKEAFRKKLKGAGICLVIIAVICIIIWAISYSEANKGLKAAESIPLGRNVEYAAAESGLEFSEKCGNGIVNSMGGFDYICVSDKNVKVCGSEQPEWAVMLKVGADGLISDVEYYDFSQLKLNWKGRKNSEKLDQNSLDFGMNIKNVSKTLGFKPYYIRRNVSNEAVYCYRYYYFDETIGCDRAFNYYVEYTDVDNSVKNVHYDEIDYAGVILSANREQGSSDMDHFAEPDMADDSSADDENASADDSAGEETDAEG